ncbi:hypothetical protein, partial [Arthrobacter sp.]
TGVNCEHRRRAGAWGRRAVRRWTGPSVHDDDRAVRERPSPRAEAVEGHAGHREGRIRPAPVKGLRDCRASAVVRRLTLGRRTVHTWTAGRRTVRI